jgi:hypothetical protein
MAAVESPSSPAPDALDDLDLALLDELASLTPAQRMARHQAALALVVALRKAGAAHYGFDPRAVAAPDERAG